MSEKQDGGPAFPRAAGQLPGSQAGMSLRDWFAGQALVGAVATVNGPGFAEWAYYADAAYQIADAMLAARKGGAP